MRLMVVGGITVQGGPNPGHVTEEKPATAAVNGLGSKSLNRYIIQVLNTFLGKRGKTPGRFGDRPYRSAFGCQKTAELRALRSDGERMLHLRARTFAPITNFRLTNTATH